MMPELVDKVSPEVCLKNPDIWFQEKNGRINTKLVDRKQKVRVQILELLLETL